MIGNVLGYLPSSKAKMKTSILWVAFVAVTAFKSLCVADTPVLGLYFVSSEPKPGWRHFDSTAFPNLGFIADRPDLLVAHIKNLYLQTTLQSSTRVHADGSSENTEEYVPTLVVEFVPEDVKALGELTAAHLGQRLLFLLGDEPLFAPVIRARIDGPSISIPLPPGSDPAKVKTDLEKLSH